MLEADLKPQVDLTYFGAIIFNIVVIHSAEGGVMFPKARFHRMPRLLRYFCLLLMTFIIIGAASGTHAKLVSTSSIYLPFVASHTCRAATQGLYCLVDLGVVGQNSQATSLNQRAVVVGDIFVPDPIGHGAFVSHAALATSGALIDLLLAGLFQSSASAINDSGLVVGDSVGRAYSWSPSAGLLLLEDPSGAQSFALSVNNAGTIVGSAWPQALVWEQNHMVVLPTLPGATQSVAYDINNPGQIVGTAEITTTHPGGAALTQAILWQNHIPQALEAPPGYPGNVARAINDAGQVAGSLYVDQTNQAGYYRSHAAIWQQNQWHDLGALAAKTSSSASDINSQGQIVGISELATSQNAEPRTHAVLWQNNSLIDLNTRIVTGNQWEMTSAVAINNAGVIVGQAQLGQEQHAVLLIPAQ